MLRETRAKWLAFATAVLVVLMTAAFAGLRNVPPGTTGDAAEAPVSATTPTREPSDEPPAVAAQAQPAAEAGRRAFERLTCAMCHAIGGRGNPDSPLDGIGSRMDRAAIRDWTTGTGAARDQLPASIARRKARAANDPELDALIDYLAQLK
jgi:cytochrome c5